MRPGRIITFYSYKGGVGRSFVLANIAGVMAQWGARVLCVDWDLEAPGLHYFFPDIQGNAEKTSLLHLLESVSSAKAPVARKAAQADDSTRPPLPWQECVNTVLVGATGKTVDLIVAGRAADDYVRRVYDLGWQALYEHHALGEFLERLRQEWAQAYDFVLLDSRTGLTDIGGICTIHLPDMVVPVFTANRQSMEGTAFMARRINEQRREFFYSSGSAIIMPLLSRWEEKDAPDDARAWWPKILEILRPSYNIWRNPDVPVERLAELLKIPYKAKWNFGERLAVLEESDTDPGSVAYHLHLVAALLVMDFAQTDLLAREPGGYVALASERAALSRTEARPHDDAQAMSGRAGSAQSAASAINLDWLESIQSRLYASGAYEGLLRRKLDLLIARNAPQAEIQAIVAELNALRQVTQRPLFEEPVAKTPTVAKPRKTIKRRK